jgi:CheY-like chemotaxis protein
MALGALIGAYQEDDAGGLRALLPLAGRTLIEYQARCLAACGAAPLVVLVERVPVALNDAFERLRGEGIAVVAVGDGDEAASRFEAGSQLILLGDGVAPDIGDLERLVAESEGAILTVPDDEAHAEFERIDGLQRWAGLARLDASMLGATAAMLGDWDLQSTLLRRVVQSGARFVPSTTGEGRGPFLAASQDAVAGYERRLLVASRTARDDAVSRYLLPVVEELATEKLMETALRPAWLVQSALAMTVAAAFCFTRGWHWGALALLLLATPLDQVAQRLAMLRLQPLSSAMLSRRLLWPASGLALLALGWFERHASGWGAIMAALAAAAFAEAGRVERQGKTLPGGEWHFSRRTAIWLAIPFAIGGWWSAYLGLLALYAAASFFIAQHFRHGVERD